MGEVEGRTALPSGSGAAQQWKREETPSWEFGLRGDLGSTPGVGGGSARRKSLGEGGRGGREYGELEGGSGARAGVETPGLRKEFPPSEDPLAT